MKRKTKSRHDNLEEFLSDARRQKGMTLNEVAVKLGLKSGQSIWDWENGKGSGIPAEMLLRLVKMYGLSSDEAYGHFIKFHHVRLTEKLERKFLRSKAKVFGRRS